MHSFRLHALGTLSCALSFACGVPVSDSKYDVAAAVEFNRIVASFSDGSASCEACLRTRCQTSIEACVDTAACTELTVCVRDEGSPAGPATCTARAQPSTLETLAAYEQVRECWVGCNAACAVGSDWNCLGGYTAAPPPRPSITVRQSFHRLCEGAPVSGAYVTYCLAEGNCLEHEVTDESGTYFIELEINTKAAVAGWSGFRRVTGADLTRPHRLERNLPIWSDQVESTLLTSAFCADVHLVGLQRHAPSANWESAMAVQFFDCQLAGADGVQLTIPTAPEANIVYIARRGQELEYLDDGSRVSGEGLAMIAGVPPGQHQLVAREFTSGDVIARATVDVPEGDLMVYSLLPDSTASPSEPTEE